LTEKFYANESWPEPEGISSLVNDGKHYSSISAANLRILVWS
jgi:hypothetical protein